MIENADFKAKKMDEGVRELVSTVRDLETNLVKYTFIQN